MTAATGHLARAKQFRQRVEDLIGASRPPTRLLGSERVLLAAGPPQNRFGLGTPPPPAAAYAAADSSAASWHSQASPPKSTAMATESRSKVTQVALALQVRDIRRGVLLEIGSGALHKSRASETQCKWDLFDMAPCYPVANKS